MLQTAVQATVSLVHFWFWWCLLSSSDDELSSLYHWLVAVAVHVIGFSEPGSLCASGVTVVEESFQEGRPWMAAPSLCGSSFHVVLVCSRSKTPFLLVNGCAHQVQADLLCAILHPTVFSFCAGSVPPPSFLPPPSISRFRLSFFVACLSFALLLVDSTPLPPLIRRKSASWRKNAGLKASSSTSCQKSWRSSGSRRGSLTSSALNL